MTDARIQEREHEFVGEFIRFDYYGNGYVGKLIRITGKGAVVRFETKTDHPKYGRIRERRIDPRRHFATFASDHTRTLAVKKLTAFSGWDELRDSSKTGYSPSLLGGFIAEVLANEYDWVQYQMGRKQRATRFGLQSDDDLRY